MLGVSGLKPVMNCANGALNSPSHDDMFCVNEATGCPGSVGEPGNWLGELSPERNGTNILRAVRAFRSSLTCLMKAQGPNEYGQRKVSGAGASRLVV